MFAASYFFIHSWSEDFNWNAIILFYSSRDIFWLENLIGSSAEHQRLMAWVRDRCWINAVAASAHWTQIRWRHRFAARALDALRVRHWAAEATPCQTLDQLKWVITDDTRQFRPDLTETSTPLMPRRAMTLTRGAAVRGHPTARQVRSRTWWRRTLKRGLCERKHKSKQLYRAECITS